MDINLLFGESYFENNSQFFCDLLISFLGAFLGFLLALLSNKWIEKRHIKRLDKERAIERFESMKHLETLIISVLSQINQQMKHYAEYANKIKGKPLEIHLTVCVSSDEIKRIQNLNKQYIISSFLFYYPTDRNVISDLFTYIDFAELRLNESFSENRRHIDYIYRDQLIIQENAENISTIFSINLMNLSIDLGDKVSENIDYNYFQQFQHIFKNITSTEPVDFDRIKREYFLRILETLTDNLSDRNLINELAFKLRKALNKIRNIEANSILFADNLLKMDSEFTICKEKLELVANRIKEINAP